jgi:formylmethanofuran dehydrogenase subunit D
LQLKVILSTGRTIAQGVGKETGKQSEEYLGAVTTVEMDPADMKRLGVRRGDLVKVKTEYGEAILRADKSASSPHQGIIFVPLGPWANLLVSPETDSEGMPSFKNVDAIVERAPAGEGISQFLVEKRPK